MIAFAGEDRVYAKNLSALLANIWSAYDRMGSSVDNDGNLDSLMLDCEMGLIVVFNIGKINVCLVGSRSTPVGILRLKVFL